MSRDVKRSGGRGATILILLIGLPFFAGGMVGCWLVFSLLSEHYASRGWVPTPADIRHVDLKRNSGSKSTTYRVVCDYSYFFNDRRYEGSRVGLMDVSDNIGSWQRDTYERLRRSYQREEPVTCYVDPHDPSSAVLDRELRFAWLAFSMIFATVFTSVGAAFVLGGLHAARSAREKVSLVAGHADQPWLHRPEWAAGVLSPQLGRKEAVAWVFAGLWNLVSSPILFIVPGEVLDKRNYPALLGLLFPLVGAGLLIWAVRATARRRKFRGCMLRLETLPGVIGGHLRGVLTLAGRLEGVDRVQIELKCLHSYTTGSGKNRRTQENTIWSEPRMQAIALTFGQTSIDIPLAFQIPYDCRPTDDARANDQIKWKLIARASAPGVDLDLDFEVPIFKTRASDERVGPAPQRIAERERVISSDSSPLPDVIREAQDGYGHPEFTIAAWPGIGFFLVVAAVDACVTGVLAFSIWQVTRGNWFLLLFVLFFGPVSLLFTLLLLSLFGRFRITLPPGQVRVERIWGVLRRTKELQAEQIQGLEVKESASAGERRFYDVYCHTPMPRAQSGKRKRKTALARNIPDELAARWLARRIEAHVGKTRGAPLAGTQTERDEVVSGVQTEVD